MASGSNSSAMRLQRIKTPHAASSTAVPTNMLAAPGNCAALLSCTPLNVATKPSIASATIRTTRNRERKRRTRVGPLTCAARMTSSSVMVCEICSNEHERPTREEGGRHGVHDRKQPQERLQCGNYRADWPLLSATATFCANSAICAATRAWRRATINRPAAGE